MAYTYPVAAVGSIHLVTFHMSWVSSQLMNTYHYRLETNPSGTSIKDLADQMNTVFSSVGHLILTHQALRDGSCFLDTIRIQQIAPTRFIPQVYVKGPGGDTAVALDASNIACVITRRGVNATRADVGSVHIPIPLDATVFSDGDWTAGWKTKMTTHAAVMQSGITLSGGATMLPVIYHRTATPNFSYIGNAFYQANVRVMRQRTKGRGI